MKTKHENIVLLEQGLNNLGLFADFNITDALVKILYHTTLSSLYNINGTESVKSRVRGYELQYEYVRRDLIKIKYKRNNFSAKRIKEGFVYAISNPAYANHIKIGSAIDVYDRLNTYQTSSPFRDYALIDYFYSANKSFDENQIHLSFDRLGEWCNCSEFDIKQLFAKKKEQGKIRIEPDEIKASMFDYWESHPSVVRHSSQFELL